MSEIFNEANMRQALERYIPDGETLLAGIHGIKLESEVRCLFGGCVRGEDMLLPSQPGEILGLTKRKYSDCDIYFGITQSFLVMADCERYHYLYEFEEEPAVRGEEVQKVTSRILLDDIGKCFPRADIQSCRFKKGWMGSVKCFITMKNGSYLKVMLPKLGGLGGGMPHHKEYREAIIAGLGGFNR